MSQRPQHVGVFGIGAIGSIISLQLHLSATTSMTLNHYGRKPKESIRILSCGEKYVLPISLQKPPYENVQLDWLIVCIKEHQYDEAFESLSKLISFKTKVAVIRNGLRLKDPVLGLTQEANILECQIDCPCQPLADGSYESFRNPIITAQTGSLAAEFSALFNDATMAVRQVEDYKTESWKKVCESSALGAILCLSGESCWIFEDPKLQDLYRQLLLEGIEVAKADGAIIEEGFTEQMMDKLLAYPKTKGSSMLTDRLNGNQIELGAKNKIISDIGKQYAVDTPLNDLVVALLSNTNVR